MSSMTCQTSRLSPALRFGACTSLSRLAMVTSQGIVVYRLSGFYDCTSRSCSSVPASACLALPAEAAAWQTGSVR